MKPFILLLSIIFLAISAQSQTKHRDISVPDTTKKIQIVEASCGQCQFHLKGKGCNLAVRIKGKAYFADGAGIDDFGDAHAADGFCKAISKAAVQGDIVKGRFKVSYFKLLP